MRTPEAFIPNPGGSGWAAGVEQIGRVGLSAFLGGDRSLHKGLGHVIQSFSHLLQEVVYYR